MEEEYYGNMHLNELQRNLKKEKSTSKLALEFKNYMTQFKSISKKCFEKNCD